MSKKQKDIQIKAFQLGQKDIKDLTYKEYLYGQMFPHLLRMGLFTPEHFQDPVVIQNFKDALKIMVDLTLQAQSE